MASGICSESSIKHRPGVEEWMSATWMVAKTVGAFGNQISDWEIAEDLAFSNHFSNHNSEI
jgi:hypothetical protein